jgi:hypothetical protein
VSTNLPRLGDNELQRLTRLIEDALNRLESNPLNNAVVLGAQTINSTDTRVYHGLGRSVAGFWVVRGGGGATVFDGAVPETIDPANYITLRASTGGAPAFTLAVY